MKKKFTQINIDDPIYRAQLSVFTGNTEEIQKYLTGKCGFPDYGEVYDAKYVSSEFNRAIILNRIDIGTLTHEVIHYCFEVFNSRGIPISHENDEVFAYYFEMTLKNIIKSVKKKLTI